MKIDLTLYPNNLNDEIRNALKEDDLSAKLEAAKKAEKKASERIINKVQEEWAKAALVTKAMMMAQEIKKAKPKDHTNNKWITDQYGNEKISNRVYCMAANIYEETKYNREIQKSESVAWYVTWNFGLNSPVNYFTKIAGQERKRYTNKAEAIKYLNGRKKAYAQFFKESNPPVPRKYVKRFSLYGGLLPGYHVEE